MLWEIDGLSIEKMIFIRIAARVMFSMNDFIEISLKIWQKYLRNG
jgi:hypothetical protein